MTDYEKVKQLFTELNITIQEKVDEGVYEVYPKVINITAEDGNNKGYYGFFTEFNFDENGKFTDVGVWE